MRPVGAADETNWGGFWVSIDTTNFLSNEVLPLPIFALYFGALGIQWLFFLVRYVNRFRRRK